METKLFAKTFDAGTVYRAETDKAYVIERIGTDSSSTATIKVEGAPVAEIINTITPKEKTGSNLFGPIDLKDLKIVVPQTKPLQIEGASGSKIMAYGKILVLAPGEALPSAFAGRYTEQRTKYITYLSGSYDNGTDTAWDAGKENKVLEYTVGVNEKIILDKFFACWVDNVSGGLLQGQFGFRIYIDDTPLDVIEDTMGKKGIDPFAAPLPPNTTNSMEVFSFEKNPIELGPGKTLKVTAINISGAAISPNSGTSLIAKVSIPVTKILGAGK